MKNYTRHKAIYTPDSTISAPIKGIQKDAYYDGYNQAISGNWSGSMYNSERAQTSFKDGWEDGLKIFKLKRLVKGET